MWMMAQKFGEKVDPRFARYLDGKEKLRRVLPLGVYSMLLTDRRVILKKNLSHGLATFSYKDIEVVEYRTSFRWMYLALAIVLFSAAYTFLAMMPEASSATTMNIHVASGSITTSQSNSAMVTYPLSFLGFAATVFGFVFLYFFVLSLFGRLRIFLNTKKSPIEITAKFNQPVIDAINCLERR